MSVKIRRVSFQRTRKKLEFRPPHARVTWKPRASLPLVTSHRITLPPSDLHSIRMLRLVRRTAAAATARTYARMSAPISLGYTHDRAEDLKENIAAVQHDVDHAAGTGAKVCTEMHNRLLLNVLMKSSPAW